MEQNEPFSMNGRPPRELLKAHLDLASLEWGYEKKEGGRRMVIFVLGGFFLFFSFIYLQFPLIAWFLKRGWGWDEIGMTLGIGYFLSALIVFGRFGKRQKGLGPPFQGTREELKRSYRWIEKNFF